MTLLVIALLAGLTIGFSEESATETDLTSYWKDQQKAGYLAASGVHTILGVLARDLKAGTNSLGEDWDQITLPIPRAYDEEGSSLVCRLADESGKLNLNFLVTPEGVSDEKRESQIRRLLKILGLKEGLADPLLDWLDADSEERPEGAEESYYKSLEEPYPCRNGPFQTLRQVLLVKGMRELFSCGTGSERGLMEDYFTVHSNGLININTASVAVLQSLSEGMDKSLAEAVVEYRRARTFEGVSELSTVPGMDAALFSEVKDLVTVKGSAYSIVASARYRGAESTVRAVVVPQGERMAITYWQAT